MAIIGNGLLANAFRNLKHEEFIIFASGVSNSQEEKASEYDRELELLKSTMLKYPNKQLVYFSTCSIYDKTLTNDLYVSHKINMENFIQANYNNYYIFRLSHVVGNTSNQTIVNFIYSSIQNNKVFDLWKNSYRNIIDVEDITLVVNNFIQKKKYQNQITNIASKYNVSVVDIVLEFENLLNKKAQYNVLNKGSEYIISIDKIEKYYHLFKIEMNSNYYKKVIRKYY